MHATEAKERLRAVRKQMEPLVSGDKQWGRRANEILTEIAELEACITFQRPTATPTEPLDTPDSK